MTKEERGVWVQKERQVKSRAKFQMHVLLGVVTLLSEEVEE